MTRKLLIAVLTLAFATFGVAACGGDDDDSVADEPDAGAPAEAGGDAGPAPGEIDVAADPDGLWVYTTDELTAEAGTVTINFDNPTPTPHDVVIEDADGNDLGGTDVITNDSTTARVDLEPGTYTYYCSVPGHREDGMEDTLVVE